MITTILHMVSAFMVTSVILHYHAKQGLPVYTYTEIWDSLSKFINFCIFPEVKVLVVQSCMTSFNTMDCSPPGSSVHGILQARILEWVAIPFSRGSSQPRDWTWVSCIAGGFFTVWATREAPEIPDKIRQHFPSNWLLGFQEQPFLHKHQSNLGLRVSLLPAGLHSTSLPSTHRARPPTFHHHLLSYWPVLLSTIIWITINMYGQCTFHGGGTQWE